MICPGRWRYSEPEHVERSVVAERGPDPAVQPSDRLEVVREHRRSGVEHGREVALTALEVARQDLDVDPRHRRTARSDRLGPDPRAAVGQIVARDPGHHDVAQSHPRDRVGDPRGLAFVDRVGLGGHHVAEPAATRALHPEQQEGRLAFLPALTDVRAHRLLAHGVQLGAAHQLLELAVDRSAGELHLQPRRLADAGLVDARLVDPWAVRHADDGQMQASSRGVVCTFGHPHRVYARAMRRSVGFVLVRSAYPVRGVRTVVRGGQRGDLPGPRQPAGHRRLPRGARACGHRRGGARRARQARPDAAGRPRRRRGARCRGQRAARRAEAYRDQIENLGDDTPFAPTAAATASIAQGLLHGYDAVRQRLACPADLEPG